jgi:hypothetical protein
MNWTATVLILLLLLGCSTSEPRGLEHDEKVWTSSELNAGKAELDGTSVLLSAYLIHETESYSLWDSHQAFERGDPKACVSLLYGKSVRRQVVKANRRQVLLRGTFARDVTAPNKVYLGLCNYTGLRVTEVIR